MAKLAVWHATITDEKGNVKPNALVSVLSTGTGNPPAILYADRGGLTPADNPITAGPDGFVEFYTAGGTYNITASAPGGFVRTWHHEGIGTAKEYDASNLIFGFVITMGETGKPGASEVLIPFNVPLAMSLLVTDATNMIAQTWFATVRVAPTASKVVSLRKNGVEFATVTFAIGATTGVIAMAADVDLISGDQLTAVMPASVDATMADFSITMLARR